MTSPHKQSIAQWTQSWAELRQCPFSFYTSTSSTNDRAKEDFQNQKTKKLFIAESQTKGRGQKQNKWINSDMMISWSYTLEQAPQPNTILLMSKALKTALEKTWKTKELKFQIKEPNDIYIQNKKLAGLLVEIVSKASLHQMIVGVGMNVWLHPEGSFTHLQKHLIEKITIQTWQSFLDEWQMQIQATIPDCIKNN